MYEDRNEPCNIVQIAEVISQIKQVPIEEVAETTYMNAMRCFGLDDVEPESTVYEPYTSDPDDYGAP